MTQSSSSSSSVVDVVWGISGIVRLYFSPKDGKFVAIKTVDLKLSDKDIQGLLEEQITVKRKTVGNRSIAKVNFA